jgi:hypothetical protein
MPLKQKTRYRYNSTLDLTEIIDADGKIAAIFIYSYFDRVESYPHSECGRSNTL